MNKCIICQSFDSKIVFLEFDIDILKCRNCGHVFSSYEAKQDYDGYYGENVKNYYWWDKLYKIIFGKINLDNLSVVAKKLIHD